MFKIKAKSICENIAFIIVVCMISSFFLFDESKASSFSVLLCAVLLFVVYCVESKFKIRFKVEPFHYFVFLFSMFCFSSSLWAQYPSRAIEKGNTILQLLICFSIVYMYYAHFSSVDRLLKATVLAGTFLSLYTIQTMGLGSILYTLASGMRMDSEFTNINSLSGVVSAAVIIAVYFFINGNIKYIITFIPNILIVAASGSRKSLVLVILGCMLIIYNRIKSKNIFVSLFKILLWGSIALVIGKTILEMPMFSMINERMEGLIAAITHKGSAEGSAVIRLGMNEIGYKQFLKKPILGIGINNSGPVLLSNLYNGRFSDAYLHNNFIELLACGGIIGFSIYYAMYVYNLIILWKNRNSVTKKTNIYLILLVCFLILDYGQVTYYSKFTYFFLLIFFLASKQSSKNIENQV